MSANCEFKEKTIGKIARTYAMDAMYDEDYTLEDIKNNFKDELDNFIHLGGILLDLTTGTDLIYNILKEEGVVDLSPEFFSKLNINDLIIEKDQGYKNHSSLDSSSENASTKEKELLLLRRNVTAQFFEDAYGMVTEARTEARNVANYNIFNSLFVNRGSIIREDKTIGVVKNVTELNENVRVYLQLLLNKIVEYLNSIIADATKLQISLKEKDALANPILYKNRVKTDVLSTLEPLINKYLSRDKYQDISDLTGTALDGLRSLYILAHDNSEPNKEKARLELDAYNAKVILLNFDKYLHILLNDSIEIANFGDNTVVEDKYKIGLKLAKILSTWTNSEERDIEGEADHITKLCINTTPLYNYKTSTPYENKFLTFADYQYLIGKIKDLAYDEDVINTKFGELDENGNIKYGTINETFWNTLHEKTKREIKGQNLSTIIAKIRKNPRKYLGILFDILNNKAFLEKNHKIFKTFKESDFNKMYSLYKGIFSLLDSNSIYNLSALDADIDYYSFITLTADTIYNTQFLLYFRDENGVLLVRTFISLNVNNLRRNIETVINTANNIRTIKDLSYFDNLNIKTIEGSDGITFTIPGTNLNVEVRPKTNNVKFISTDGKPVRLENYWNLAAIQLFIDSKLRIGLYLDIDLLNILLEKVQGLKSNITKTLLSFASHIVLNLYLTYQKINPESLTIQLDLVNLFGEQGPLYNKQTEIIESINKSDISTLYIIAEAKANVTGITTATLVKDGEGNGQSLQTQSRLLGSHLTLFELLEKQENSATNECLILTVPGLYEGVYVANEYYDIINGSKKFVDMCVSEFTHASFVYDYIGGLARTSDSDNSVVGKNHVMFLHSVNSDKVIIDRIMIDLNKEVLLPDGRRKKLVNLNSNELRSLIAKLFGTIYIKIYENVLKDWDELLKYITNEFPDCPSLNYLNNFKEFNEWWYLNQKYVSRYGKNPSEFIKYFTLLYNKSNRLHPLTIVDQTYLRVGDKALNINGNLVKVKKALGANQVLISQIARFNPLYLKEKGINIDNYFSEGDFWHLKHREVLKSLIKSRFLINTTDKNLPEFEYLKEHYPDWINTSGNVILAKAIVNGQETNITSTRDLIKLLQYEGLTFLEIIDNLNLDLLELHPAIENWNYLNYLFSLEFMDCTVGSFINHIEKSKDLTTKEITKKGRLETFAERVLRMEAAQFQAQHKRNVSFTASMHEFLLNLLNGIPEEYNLAVIEDIKDYQGTITGNINEIKPFDGATFVNPFVVLLENNSLGGARAGITKKQFVHFKNERIGGGGIIKTCGFGLTNDWIRNSPFLLLMMQKMTNHIWLNKDGSPAIVDITRDYLNNSKIILKNKYFRSGNRVFEIIDILSKADDKTLGNNEYRRVLLEIALDENGNPIANLYISKPITESKRLINTNYELWNYLGGKDSMSVNGNTLEYSNSSVENVVKIMNRTAGLDIIGKIITENGIDVKLVETLEDLWLPLKLVDVHYVATAGAVKQGAANINTAAKYDNNDDYDIQRIKMYQAGILLDKEHHADDAELSLMTLVISACAAKGYTFEAAARIYGALRKATEIGINDHLLAVKEYITSDNINGVLEVMFEAIINSLAGSKNQNNFAYLVASDLIKLAREGKKVKFADANLPLSDKTVYSKILSTVASYLTNAGIKLKIPGILSVLTPSHNIFKIYGDRKYESFTNPQQELEELLKEEAPVFDSAYQWTQGLGDFAGLQLVYVNPGELISQTDGQPVAMRNPHDGRVLIDLELMRIKFEQKAWRNTRNSEPLDYDFKSFDEWMRFALLHEVMHNVYLIKEGESRFDYETRVNKQALKRLQNNISNIELGREYFVTRNVMTEVEDADGNLVQVPVPVTQSELIRTPLEYHKLKQDILNGEVTTVIENVTVGRDLAAYNVRFNTTDGSRFQLWDLDSAVALFKLDQIRKDKNLTSDLKNVALQEIKNELFPEHNFKLKDLEKHIRRMLLKDLMNLSKSTPDIMQLYDSFLLSLSSFILDIDTETPSFPNEVISNATATHGVKIDPNLIYNYQSWLLLNPDGIVAYRVNKENFNTPEVVLKGVIGNPFDWLKYGNGKATLMFLDWIITGNNFKEPLATPEFRYAIINKILSTEHPNILYYKELGRPSHATVLGYLIENKKLLKVDTWYDKYARWINIYFGTGLGNLLDIPGFQGRVTSENFADVESKVRKLIENSTKVRIGGNLHTINKESIKTLAYELIMPKTFATSFGLKPFDDLYTIKNDRDWFVKLYIRNQEVKVDKNNYSIALKTSSGKHTYILSKSLLDIANLKKVEDFNIGKQIVDGKTLRLNEKGDILYEITDDFELYTDDLGNEVIATDNPNFYVNNLSFESIQFSEALLNRTIIFRNILELLGKSSNKVIQRFLDYIKKDSRNNLEVIFNKHLEYNKVPDKDSAAYEGSRLVKFLREKHSSFLKALDVVAARIPSLSMQSFMPMRVIAFDNPDINTAHVSTLQILLLGSDYRLYTVVK